MVNVKIIAEMVLFHQISNVTIKIQLMVMDVQAYVKLNRTLIVQKHHRFVYQVYLKLNVEMESLKQIKHVMI